MTEKHTSNKILRASYYWPSLYSDVFAKVCACENCQNFARKEKLTPLPLKPISVKYSFLQWKWYFTGEIHPPSTGQHKWILTTTDYFTKRIEAILVRNATDTVIIKLLLENNFSRFVCPHKFVIDNAQSFKSSKLVNLCANHNGILCHSTPYYPQGNKLAESSNKSFAENKKGWDSKLVYALWADRINNKKSIGSSPFQLMYGVDVVIPVQLALLVIIFLQEEMEDPNPS